MSSGCRPASVCVELQEAEGKELHESSTRTVQVRRTNPTFRTRVSCTGRAREKWFRTWVSYTDRVRGFGSARVSSTGRVREACALIFRVARGVLLNTDRVVRLACTGLGRLQHGACRAYFQHEACDLARVTLGSARVQLLLHGLCNFLFF